MANKRWVMGCGIGCGIILLIVVALFVAGGMWIKDTARGFEGAIDLRAQLEQRFGERGDFTPWPDGAVPADRMRAFLAIRDATEEPREAMVEFFNSLPTTAAEAQEFESKKGVEKARSVFGIVGSAFGFGKHMGAFFETRNRAMLEQGMGMGEYTYLYVLVYRSWLGHKAVDGPGIDVEGESTNISEPAGPELMEDLRRMLAMQLAALPADAEREWRMTVAKEVEAMEQDHDRRPWQGSVPDIIAASLEPFREDLERTYNPAASMFELSRNTKKGRLSYGSD